MTKDSKLIDEINLLIKNSKNEVILEICNNIHNRRTKGVYYLTDLVFINLLSIFVYLVLASTEKLSDQVLKFDSDIDNIEDISSLLYSKQSSEVSEYFLKNFGFLLSEPHIENSLINNMTELSLISRFKIFFYKKIYLLIRSNSRIPLIACSHFLDIFQEKKFFLKYFEHYSFNLNFINTPSNSRSLLSKIIEKHKFNDLILKLSVIKGIDPSLLQKKLSQYLIDFYPNNHLENLNQNLDLYVLNTKKYLSKYVVSEGEGLTKQYFAIASAFELNKKVIRYIHGGSALYLKGNENSLSIMFPYTDLLIIFSKLIRYPEEITKNNFLTIELPNPWLSEKFKRNIKNEKLGAKVLYLPMMIKRLPAFPFGSGYSLPEDKDLILSYITDFLKYSEIKKTEIEIKPFNKHSYTVIQNKFNNKSIVYNGNKSLSKNDYKQYSCVIYDTPGTGFLECVATNYPTYLIWDSKITNNYPEFDFLFESLERSKILFRNFKDFFDYYDPNIDFFTSDRVISYDLVRNTLCVIDRSWEFHWSGFLNKIKYETN